MKRQRGYRLTIQISGTEEIVITNPLTIKFDVNRTISNNLNKINLQIYNLSQTNRDRIFQDRFRLNDFGSGLEYKRMVLQAGYGDLATIFAGNILEAYSYREGPDIITVISGMDGLYGINNSFSNRTFAQNFPVKDFVSSLLQDMKNVVVGTLGDVEGDFPRGVVANGNTWQLLKRYQGDNIFIDQERVNLLKEDEVIEGQIPVINSDTGLLSTPQRQNTWLVAQVLFEPRLTVGQSLQIESQVNTIFDGQYRIDGVQHQATISDAVGGDARTTLQLFLGTPNLTFKNVSS
jgi:hypothetical protein